MARKIIKLINFLVTSAFGLLITLVVAFLILAGLWQMIIIWWLNQDGFREALLWITGFWLAIGAVIWANR